MKQLRLSLVFVLFIISATGVMAQRDSDGDGLPDTRDNCPNQAGPKTNNGCPELGFTTPPTPTPDTDGDGLPDPDDNCPTVPGPHTNQGCPEPDNPPPPQNEGNPPPANDPPPDTDGDGVPDPNDGCPNQAGPAHLSGCPDTSVDTDGDTIPDVVDECPDVTGTIDRNGCPEPPFRPPALPVDGCFVTPEGDYRVMARDIPDLAGNILGYLAPGNVYEALGYVMNGTDIWFVLDNYENYSGVIGFASRSVLLATTCPEIDVNDMPDSGVPTGGMADDFQSNSDSPTLCTVTVGYDSPIWSDDPAVPSVVYAVFWFEAQPATYLIAGTPIWGVAYQADFITINNFPNLEAVVTNQQVYEEAMNSEYAGAYNWPTLLGGVQDGDSILYRLSPPEGYNDLTCGPIIGIDDILPIPTIDEPPTVDINVVPVVNEYACTITIPFNWVFAFNYAPGESIPVGTSPIAILNGSPDFANVAADWTAELINNADGEPVQWMVEPSWSSLYRTGGTCGPIVGRDGVFDRKVVQNAETRALFDYIAEPLKGCEDGQVWWAGLPSPNDLPEEDGNCEDDINTILATPLPTGHTRVIAGQANRLGIALDMTDCNLNGVPDTLENPTPNCFDSLTLGDNGETRQSDSEWWATVLDLVCPGEWLIMLDTNADGEEIVTDAQCEEDI